MVNGRRVVLVFSASRAEYSRQRSVLAAIRNNPGLELRLAVAGAHMLERFGQSVRDIEADGFEISERIYQNVEGENLVTMAKSTGYTIVELASVIDRHRPDVALVMGDRFEALAFAAVAALMNVHVAHIQGGEVTGTIDESIRHAITKLSHIHFAATRDAAERIVRMGEEPDRVHQVGCPAVDTLLATDPGTRASALKAIEPWFKIAVRPDPARPYLLAVYHPVTTEYRDNRRQVEELLSALRELGLQTIMLWPNLDAGSDEISQAIRHHLIRHPDQPLFLFKHFPVPVFTGLQANADCLVGNSSAGMREACYFGTPVVNIGSRQHGRERGRNVADVPAEAGAITQAIRRQLDHGRYPVEQVYGDGQAGRRIADILAGTGLGSPQKRITY